jgi:TRAP-type C4-dicarboxylate transport system permease small subunit
MIRAFERLLEVLAIVGAAIALGLVLAVTGEVVLRNTINTTIPGIDELSEYGLYLMCLLPSPWLVHKAQHIRIDILVVALPKNAARVLEAVVDVAAGIACLIFAYVSVQVIKNSLAAKSLVYKTWQFPEYWIYLPLPVVMVLMAICFAIRVQRGVPKSDGPSGF